MISKEEVSKLKARHSSLEQRMNQLGKRQFPTTLRLAALLKELIEEIEDTQEREKDPRNQVVYAKIKIVKYGIKLSKKLKYFEEEIVKEFDKGNLAKDVGRKFVSITKLIKKNRMPDAKAEYAYFQEIIEMGQEYDSTCRELESQGKALRAEQQKLKGLLAELSWLETQSINPEKARSYEDFLRNLEKLGKLRGEYLHSLASKPVAALLEDAGQIKDHLPVFPAEGEIAGLRAFFSEYPAIGRHTANGICELFTFSEKKLSHICPETSKFKKTVLGNKKWFETLRTLEQSSFLALDEGNETLLDFYAENVPGAEKIVAQVKLLREDKSSSREEYEKSRKIEEKRKELSGCSKKGLEAELETACALLEFLESSPWPMEEDAAEESEGLLSRISSLFKS